MLITTSIDLPGYDVVAVQGEVFGLTVRARNIGAGCLAAPLVARAFRGKALG